MQADRSLAPPCGWCPGWPRLSQARP